MSSSSGYLTELSSYDSNNSTTENGTNIYTDINDKGLQVRSKTKRRRPLPMPPAFKPLRPRKNYTLCFQSCRELCSYCGHSRLILSITLLVLAVASLGVVTYLVVTNIKVFESPKIVNATEKQPDGDKPCPTSAIPLWTLSTYSVILAKSLNKNYESTRRTYRVPEGSNGTLKFSMPPVQNPEVLDLIQESIGQNVTILHLPNVKLNFTDITWLLDGREISIGISNTDNGAFHILLNVDISNSQCRHAGKYFVLLYGINGKAEKSLSYNVKAACPCEADFDLMSSGVLACELQVIGSTTLNFDKVSGANTRSILYRTGIRIPDNVPERDRFTATWKPDGTLITRITFSPVQCHDKGNYSLTVTSRAGTRVHYIYVKVIDHPEQPTISIPNGLIEDKESELQCQASIGCRNASVRVEAAESNGQDYDLWEKNLTQKHYQEGGIWKTKVTLILTKFEVNLHTLQDRLFRCTYSLDGKNYNSQVIRMKIVPADFCKYKTSKCDYPHPYDCNKYITCTTIPVERICLSGLHFMNSVNCEGRCVYPNEANCNIGR